MLRQTSRALKGLAEARPGQQRTLTTAHRATAVAARRNSPANARNQSTTAATKPTATETRPKPSQSFNAATKDRNNVQPLVNPRKSDMDESFIGKTGGEIFHEMMLRHDVKHICASSSAAF
jgi:acetolactate synthase-1/2/3 large subunit